MRSIGGKIIITAVLLVIIFEFDVVSCTRPGGRQRVQVNMRAKFIISILWTLIFFINFQKPNMFGPKRV
ncbi:unnamed protein product [Meloidogyne enterolobii]|uniref:Uncharacterized protein n=1 Tax=Meloidogyne enterolobii TaxID=390850 RepID=A0ACB1A0N2_MELEN